MYRINNFAVVKSRDIPICKLLAKCREMISLVDFVENSVTLHLMNIDELVLRTAVSSRVYVMWVFHHTTKAPD